MLTSETPDLLDFEGLDLDDHCKKLAGTLIETYPREFGNSLIICMRVSDPFGPGNYDVGLTISVEVIERLSELMCAPVRRLSSPPEVREFQTVVIIASQSIV
jgi:hypothetical protein